LSAVCKIDLISDILIHRGCLSGAEADGTGRETTIIAIPANNKDKGTTTIVAIPAKTSNTKRPAGTPKEET
jgi:hypothetical protein